MAEGYGNVATIDILREQLNNDSWKNLYSNLDLAKQQLESSALYDYSKTIGEAYASSLQQKQNIMSSNIGQGFKSAYTNDLNTALSEAYTTALSEYTSNLQSIEESTSESLQSIYNAQTQEATYAQQLINSPYERLKSLYENNPEVFNREYFQQFVNPTTGKLKEWSVINQGFYDTSDPLSTTATMNEAGQKFYNILFGDTSLGENVPSYADWLYNYNEELANWAYNNSNANYNTIMNLLEVNPYADNKISSYDLPDKGIASIKTDILMKSTEKGGYGVTENDYSNRVSNDSATVKSFTHADGSYFYDQGTGKGDQDKYVQKVIDMAKKGEIEDGTVVNMNFGKGTAANYVYYNGYWYRTSKKADIYEKNKDFGDYVKQYFTMVAKFPSTVINTLKFPSTVINTLKNIFK